MILCGCGITKHLQPNEWLIKKNEIEIQSPLKLATKNISKKELLDIAKPAENKSMFGFLKPLGIRYKFKLMVFNKYSNGKLNRFKDFMQNKVGEPPSIYDSMAVRKSVLNMQEYLFNKGYYDGTVDAKVKKKNQKASVKYIIQPKYLYVINGVVEISDNTIIQQLLKENIASSFFKKNDAYSSLNVKQERERIELLLRNNGYYNFSQQYIFVELDTAIANTKKNIALGIFSESKRPVNLKLIIKNPDNDVHEKFTIDKIFIFPNHHTDSSNNYTSSDTFQLRNYNFVAKKMNIKTGALLDNIFIQPNTLYSLKNQQQTNTRLSALGFFKTVNIQYLQTAKNKLDCYIFLVQNQKYEYGYELVASTNTDFFGFGLNAHGSSKNIFRTADLLTINLKSSLESPYENPNHKFRTLDLGAQSILQFPRFIVPFRVNKISPYENPTTKFSAAFNYLERQDYYKQNQTNFSFGYDWNETKRKHHYLNPFVLSFINYNQITDSFQHILSRNPLLQGSFKPQLIPGLNYTFSYSNFDPNVIRKANYFFKSTIDLAGNLSMLIARNIFQNTASTVKLFGNELSQFAKLDIENRVNLNLGRHHNLVLRTATGAGLAYGNSNVLPYIKQFYSGGPNSMRGWRARTLGPGVYADPNLTNNALYVNETGDIRLEGNVEYRFDLWWYFKGAIFSDVGNIWLMKKDANRPGAEFDFSKFYNQLAVDAGLGLRFDYNYFLLRLDIGFPLVNPVLPTDQKWLGNKIDIGSSAWRSNNLKYNLAVGYPF